jgi:uncharacterized protein YggE
MRLATTALLIVSLAPCTAVAQIGGMGGGGQASGRARARQLEQARSQQTRTEPPSDSTMFLEANVLMNVKADEYVATFGVAEEGETVEACQTKMDATLAALTEALKPLGFGPKDLFVDFAAQTKVYGYKVEGNLAREQLVGFELKKTVAIRFRDQALFDRLVAAASRAKIYDLVKVDYVVTKLAPIQERLAEEAAAAIKAKAARHERFLGIRLRPVPQLYGEIFSTYYPTEMYDSYTGGESEMIAGDADRARMTVQSLRKGRTFYYHPLDADGFDRVIDPVILEPVVQFTLYLKLKYEIETRR